MQLAEAVQAISEVAEDAARKPCKRKELPFVGVAGELQADARLLDDGQAIGNVIEQNACPAGS